MKRNGKKIIAWILAMSMGTVLAGCNRSGGEVEKTTSKASTEEQTTMGEEAKEKVPETTAVSSESHEPVTIRFSWWGGDSRHEATEKLVKAFMEKYPYITVDTEYGAWTGWEEKQSLSILSGDCADVMQIGTNWVTDYSRGGTTYYDLYQLKDIIDLSQFPEEKLKLNEVDGKLMAIPNSLTGRLFYWNKTTFDEIGCAIPTDEESLLAAGAAFKAYGEEYYPLALAEYDRMIFMVYYLESKYGKDWVTDGKMNYTEQEIAEGFAFINKLEDEHVLPSIAIISGDMADSMDKNSKWIDGKYAGVMEWDSAVSKVRGAMEESVNKQGQEFVIGEFINFGQYQGGFTKISMNMAIKAGTEHPKEAAMLVNYLLNDPEGVEINSTERGIPCSLAAVSYLNEKNIGDAMTKEANSKVLSYSQFTQDPKFDDNDLKANPDGLYYKLFGRLSTRDITPEEAAAELVKGVNRVLADE